MRKRVVVTGLGVISPWGNDVNSLWQGILAGKSGVSYITHYDTSDHKTKFAAQVKDFDAAEIFGAREARRIDRFAQFALWASIQAVQDSRLEITDDNRDRIGCVIGSGVGGISTIFEQVQVFFNRGGALRHVGLYAYRVGVLKRITRLPPTGLEQHEKLEQLRALEHGLRIVVARCVEPPAPGVDTAADLERARLRVAALR